jgi:hypothetical protein
MIPGRCQQAPSLALQAEILGVFVSRQAKCATSKITLRVTIPQLNPENKT